MADETLDQRLTRIEAALPTLATKADLENFATKADLENFATKADLRHFAESIEGELHRLTELVSDALAEARKAREETRYVSGLVGGMAMAGASLADYVRTLGERVERLEKRDPPATG